MTSTKLPWVTIGIPFYNAERFLLDAIRSVFAQTHSDWELILIDDGSTDRSLEIAKSVKDQRVSVYSDGQNRRLAARLNQITLLAKHDFIARMDADDLMTPDRIEKLLSILHYHNEYDLASCGTYSIGVNKSLKGYRAKAETDYTFEGLLHKSQGFLHAGLVARKTWYERNQYDETLLLGQDIDLWLRAAKAGDFHAISVAKPMYMYREEGNVTLRKLLAAYRVERSNIAPLISNSLYRHMFVIKSLAKSALVVVMARAGMLHYLLKRRNRVDIDDHLFFAFTAALEQISKTNIPGVEDD